MSLLSIFGRPFVKRFALCYLTVVLSVLSVTLVYCGQTVGWIKMPLGMEVGLSPGDTVLDIALDGDPAPHFSAHVYCGQTIAHLSYWWALVFLCGGLDLGVLSPLKIGDPDRWIFCSWVIDIIVFLSYLSRAVRCVRILVRTSDSRCYRNRPACILWTASAADVAVHWLHRWRSEAIFIPIRDDILSVTIRSLRNNTGRTTHKADYSRLHDDAKTDRLCHCQ